MNSISHLQNEAAPKLSSKRCYTSLTFGGFHCIEKHEYNYDTESRPKPQKGAVLEGDQTENRPNPLDQRTKPKQPPNQKENKKIRGKRERDSIPPKACEPKKPIATTPRLRYKSKYQEKPPNIAQHRTEGWLAIQMTMLLISVHSTSWRVHLLLSCSRCKQSSPKFGVDSILWIVIRA